MRRLPNVGLQPTVPRPPVGPGSPLLVVRLKGARTFGEQVKHVACANFAFFNEIGLFPVCWRLARMREEPR
jgi:hypothetical protein